MDINKKSRTELKAYFVKNAIPTESNFRDLVDATLMQKDDGITKAHGDPLSLEAAADGEKKSVNFYENFADTQPAWVLSLLPGWSAADPTLGKRGLGIRDGAGNPRLFIDSAAGNVGLGTLVPQSKLDIVAKPRTGVHPTGLGLYVTGDAAKGIEFRQSDASQGLGLSATALYSTGTNQDLTLSPNGTGKVSIPNRLDVQAAPRTGTHGTGMTLYVTGNLAPDSGIEFRHTNGTQGIGFGYNTIYTTGANQDLTVAPNGTATVALPAGLRVDGNRAAHLENDGSLYRFGGQVYLTVDDNFYLRGTGQASPVVHLDVSNGGRLGVGMTGPQNRVDIAGASRTGTHATGMALYATGLAGKGIEFRQSDATLGMGLSATALYATGTNQDLVLSPTGSGAVNAAAGLRIDGNRSTHIEADGSFYRYNGQAYLTIDDNLYVRGTNQASPVLHFDITNGGRLGVGVIGPNNQVDIQAAGRTGTHASGQALYVTANSNPAGNGVEFRHSNGTSGIGFGYNTIYATGTYVDQSLFIQARGAGRVDISQEDWRGVTLQNGWSYWGSQYNAPGYFKDSCGRVHLRGLIKGGAVGGAIIFTLPAGYLPQNRELLLTIAAENIAARIDIDANGNVMAMAGANATWLSLDGLSFRAYPYTGRL